LLQVALQTGVARNFDWEGPNWKKFVTFFGDVMMMAHLNDVIGLTIY